MDEAKIEEMERRLERNGVDMMEVKFNFINNLPAIDALEWVATEKMDEFIEDHEADWKAALEEEIEVLDERNEEMMKDL